MRVLSTRAVRAVLFDRDGTLVHDEPYNGDPERVRLTEDADRSVARLRSAGLRIGMITNQSGVARGLIGEDQVARVNARVEELLGPFDTVQVCPHGDGDGCACRKPAPGMVLSAARELGVPPQDVVVIGDIGADIGAARAAGARAVLVPTPVTRQEEVTEAADLAAVATSLTDATTLVLWWAGRLGCAVPTLPATPTRRQGGTPRLGTPPRLQDRRTG